MFSLIACLLFLMTKSLSAGVADTTQWRQLFNGKDLTGWKQGRPGSHYVEDGLLSQKEGMGYFTGQARNLEIVLSALSSECVMKTVTPAFLSGFPQYLTEDNMMPVNTVTEVPDCNNTDLSGEDDYHYTGMLYSLTKPLAKTGKPGPQWNTMEITLDGPRTIVYLNGVKVTDYKER